MSRLKLKDKRSLAEAIAGDAESHAIAAFYCIAVGEQAAAGSHLRQAGPAAKDVHAAFK
jgi:hypothetical protein